MLKSTVGTWVNYGTTALFYVLFARSFGATSDASAFLTTVSIAVAMSGIFTGTAQSIYIPRLLGAGDEIVTAGIRRMCGLTLVALVVFLAFGAGAAVLAPLIAPTLDHPGVNLVELMRYAALFGFFQVLVGQLAALSWARGSRFVPAVTPAIPSLVASIPLFSQGHASTRTLYLLMTVGSLLQVALLAGTSGRGLSFSAEPLHGLGRLTFGWLGAYSIAQVIVPFEVLIAAHASASGGAHFNYAYRGLTVAQLLIVGGLAFAALPHWSGFARAKDRAELERSIVRAISLAALALSLAAAIALVASQTLVRLAFQHGGFTAHDTEVVSRIVDVALFGFVAEGVMLVLSPALVADRRNHAAITLGIARTGVVLVLVAILGLTDGPVGVAIGYSLANVLALSGLLIYVVREGMITRANSDLAWSSALVAVLTAGVAGAVLLLDAPPVARPVLVVAAFLAAALSVRSRLPPLRLPAS